jgi:hypothetical protein
VADWTLHKDHLNGGIASTVMTIRSRLGRSATIAALWIITTASIVHAHGGIAGPDELGPPVIISTLLGIGCYWTVVLWPSRRNRNVHRIDRAARRATR